MCHFVGAVFSAAECYRLCIQSTHGGMQAFQNLLHRIGSRKLNTLVLLITQHRLFHCLPHSHTIFFLAHLSYLLFLRLFSVIPIAFFDMPNIKACHNEPCNHGNHKPMACKACTAALHQKNDAVERNHLSDIEAKRHNLYPLLFFLRHFLPRR